MSKGSKRRPTLVSREQADTNYIAFQKSARLAREEKDTTEASVEKPPETLLPSPDHHE